MKKWPETFSEKLLHTSLILLFSLVFTFIISLLGLVFNIEICSLHYPLGFTLSIIFIKIIDKKIRLLLPVLFSIIIIPTLLFLLSKTHDVSWDGQWYHQDAIIKLNNHWNPVYSMSDTTLSISESDIWIHHYPHASWIVKASIFKLTGLIQSTKAITLLLSICTLFLSFYVLKNIFKIKLFNSIILSLCIAFNPITYSQFLSFCIDGEVSMLLSIYILLLLSNIKKSSKLFFISIILVFAYTINIKFTTLVYLSVFNLFYFFYLIINFRSKRAKIFSAFSLVYLLSVFLLGYTSYTRNTLEKGHPLYPIMGKNSYGHIVAKVPESANFVGKNRFQNFISASFAYPKYSRSPDSSSFRMPFTKVNYDQYYRVDSEMSGFGARWSEILIFTVVLFLLTLLFLRKKEGFISYLIILTILLISVSINEQSFVARYIPQLWLLPIIICSFVYLRGHKLLRIMSTFLIFFLLYNTYKITERQIQFQKEVINSIKLENEYLKGFNKPIPIKCKYLSVPNRLKENNIPFVYIEEETDKEHHQFNHTYETNYYIIP